MGCHRRALMIKFLRREVLKARLRQRLNRCVVVKEDEHWAPGRDTPRKQHCGTDGEWPYGENEIRPVSVCLAPLAYFCGVAKCFLRMLQRRAGGRRTSLPPLCTGINGEGGGELNLLDHS